MKKTKSIKKAEEQGQKRVEEMIEGKTNPAEKSVDTGSEKMEEERSKVPPFPPPPKGTESHFSPMSSETDEPVDFEAIDIEEFSKDIVNIPFEIWHIINPNIEPLSTKEKKLIGKPLSRVIIKHELQKYAKDEFVLVAFLSFAILGRLKKDKGDSPEKEVIG